ncbi:MAG: hypothetical protein BECKG1743E_GA0114224_105321 [Candidatus Kentron sp. G]|nr:MAG: hypothetical protein BECKG1743E_GA0114224_105321 [Candidatus Kentron sp. G]
MARETATKSRNATFPGGRGSCRAEEGSNDFPTARQEPRPPVGSVPGKTCTKNKKWQDSSTKKKKECPRNSRKTRKKSDFSVFSASSVDTLSSSCSFVDNSFFLFPFRGRYLTNAFSRPIPNRKTHTASVIPPMDTTEMAAPKGQSSPRPKADWIRLPIMMPVVPPTSFGVT